MTAPTDAQRAWKSGQMRRRPTTVTAAPVTTRVELPTVMPAPRPVAAKVRALPAARPAVDRSWRDDALCAQVDPELWYPEVAGTSSKDAKRICGRCPVRKVCLDDAITTGDTWGVRGGLSANQRRKLLRGAA